MARLRRDTVPVLNLNLAAPPLRIFATGAVFLTHSLVLATHPLQASVSRAQSVYTARGGAAAHVLALLAQLAASAPELGVVEPMLIASLGGSPDAVRLRDALESVGVRTKYCKSWPGLGVPSAWVLHARDTDARTVINHNPLPEVSHEDFIALLGPLLAPENYVGLSPSPPLTQPLAARDLRSPSPVSLFPNTLAPSAPRPSMSSHPNTAPSATSSSPTSPQVPTPNPSSPAPFDWLHLEGRNVRTTIANLVGVDGLARERKWRAHCVISVDLGRRARDGVQVLIPHADVVFLTPTTFASDAPAPRALLLSLARHAPPHALLVLNAGRDGAALLSLPTSEYLQSSGWTRPARPRTHAHSVSSTTTSTSTNASTTGAGAGAGAAPNGHAWDGIESVRSGSEFWAAVDGSFASQDGYARARPSGESFHPMDDEDEEDEEGQGSEGGRRTPQAVERRVEVRVEPAVQAAEEGEGEELDEEGAHAAFVAGMIWALSRRVLPGPPYVPGLAPDVETKGKDGVADVGIRWRLDECLRFATELACRKAYSRASDIEVASVASSSGSAKERNEWDGLGEAMRMARWFD